MTFVQWHCHTCAASTCKHCSLLAGLSASRARQSWCQCTSGGAAYGKRQPSARLGVRSARGTCASSQAAKRSTRAVMARTPQKLNKRDKTVKTRKSKTKKSCHMFHLFCDFRLHVRPFCLSHCWVFYSLPYASMAAFLRLLRRTQPRLACRRYLCAAPTAEVLNSCSP